MRQHGALPAEYRAEPELALAGGGRRHGLHSDGCSPTRRRMSEKAVLVLEIGNERENFERAFPQLEPVWLETSSGPTRCCC
jgi:ribosomal protein L3 glutamine methyltransferase